MLIYKIFNKKNDHFYIGMTSTTLEKRWASHLGCVKTGKTALYKAMREYGVNDFEISLIEICNSLDHMAEREDYYLKTLRPHYNLRFVGGTGGDTSHTPNHLNARHLMASTKNTIWYNNGSDQKRCVEHHQPPGYVKGRLFTNGNHPNKIKSTFLLTCPACGNSQIVPDTSVNRKRKYCNLTCNGIAKTLRVSTKKQNLIFLRFCFWFVR